MSAEEKEALTKKRIEEAEAERKLFAEYQQK